MLLPAKYFNYIHYKRSTYSCFKSKQYFLNPYSLNSNPEKNAKVCTPEKMQKYVLNVLCKTKTCQVFFFQI